MKKLLSILLAVLMVVTLGVVNVTAEENESTLQTPTETQETQEAQLLSEEDPAGVNVATEEELIAALNGTSENVVLSNNIALSSMLEISSAVVLDLNGFSLTMSESFAKNESDENQNMLVQVNAADESVVIKNGSIEAGEYNKHTLNIYQSTNVVLQDLSLVHNGYKGAPLVVNESSVSVKGNMSFTLGANSWYAINVDKGGAYLNLSELQGLALNNLNGKYIILSENHAQIDYGSANLSIAKSTVNNIDVYGFATVKVGNALYLTLNDAISNVADNETITLLNDLTVENLTINNGKTFKLDLNGKKLTTNKSVIIKNAFVTVSNGEIDILNGNSIFLYTSNEDQKYCSFNIGTDATIKSEYGVIIFQNDVGANNYGVELNVDGNIIGNSSGIWVMGNIYTDNDTATNPIVINVNDNAKIEAQGVGVALAGSSVTTLGKCTINGKEETGLEIRAGKLIVNGAEISSNAVPTEVEPNGSGTTTTGAAIAVAQHTTKLPIDVVINDGKFSAYTPLNHSDPQNNELDNIKITVNGGIFNPILGGTCPINSHNLTKFVNGGSFYNYAPEDKYAADGKAVFFARKNLYEVDTDPDKVSVLFDYSYVEKDFDLALGNFAWQNFTFTRNGKELDHHYVTYTVTKGDALKVNEYGYLDFTDKTGLVEVTATCGSQSASAYVYIVDSYETTDEGAASSDENTTSSTLNTESSKVIESIVANDSKTFEAKASLANGVTFEELKNDILGGKTVETVLDSNKVDTVSNETTNAAVAAAEAQLGGGAKVAGSYDIQVKLIVDGKQKANITSLDNAIQLQIELPEEIRTVPGGYSREVAIVRMHNGVATVIAKGNVSELGSTITCSSNLFSEYVLVYRDTLDYVYTKPAAKKPVVNTSVR